MGAFDEGAIWELGRFQNQVTHTFGDCSTDPSDDLNVTQKGNYHGHLGARCLNNCHVRVSDVGLPLENSGIDMGTAKMIWGSLRVAEKPIEGTF